MVKANQENGTANLPQQSLGVDRSDRGGGEEF
jgi:hypothetical protein